MTTQKHCSGCRDDFYNHNRMGLNETTGRPQCWNLKDATMVEARDVHIDMPPPRCNDEVKRAPRSPGMTQDEIDRARRGVSTLLDVMRPNCVINATFVPAIHAAIDAAEDALRAAQGRPTIEVRWTQQSMRYGRATTVSHTGERDEALAALLAAQEQREWRAELESAADRERVTLDELRELRRQLPKGMEHCTILLKECAKGHGWLTAENWVQHGCPTCEADALREALAALIAAQGTPTCATCERWAPTSRTESFCERFSRFMDPDDGCIKGYRAGSHRDRGTPGAQA